jgi:ferrochelatase
MRLVNILALTQAKLVNEPFVSNFENIIFDAKKVKRGDLFIAFVEDDIQEAILNGAYGIVFDKDTKISDSEIAWIQVKDLCDAIKKLLRFRLIEKHIRAYRCDEVTIKLAKQIAIQNNTLLVLDSEVKEIFSYLYNIEKNTIILFSPSLTDETLFVDIQDLPKNINNLIKIKEKTIFETSFVYKDIFYERQQISPLFIPFLEKLLSLLDKLGIDFRLKKFTHIKHFEPVFVNKYLMIKDFGSTDRVIIFEKDKKLINLQIDFLKKNAPWAKIIIIIKIKKKESVLKILRTTEFNFALVLGFDKSILKNETSYSQLSLF